MTVPDLTKHTANTPAVSLRERSSADLIQAIHSPGDEPYVLERARICLRAFFEPGMDDQTYAALIGEFGRALRKVPRWAVARAFDNWMRTRSRRPSPGDINNEAQLEIRELADELAYRKRMEAPAAPERQPVDQEEATRILTKYGFTPQRMEAVRKAPMARTLDEATARAETPRTPHWSETAAPDSPQWRQLRAVRDANPIMQETRRRQKATDERSCRKDDAP